MAAPETTTEVSATARRLIGQYGWQLLGANELATLAGAEAGAPPTACYSAAGRALYAACVAGSELGATEADRQRQAVAYADLGRYLSVLAGRLPLRRRRGSGGWGAGRAADGVRDSACVPAAGGVSGVGSHHPAAAGICRVAP